MADITGKITSIKAELKAATNEAQQLGIQLANMRESANGIDGAKIASLEKDFQTATQRASQLKDQINDTNEQIGVLTAGSKFEVMGNGIKDVAGKIASMDFEGAAESANRLVKLSKSINFGDAVKGIKDIGSTFLSLGKALLTNPLFLIAGAIALAVTYSKELLTLIDGVSGKDEERLKTLTKQAEASKAQLDSIGAQEETLKRNGLSEEEILQLKIDAAKVAAADAKAQLEQQKTIRDNQIKASERNAKILAGVLQFITAPLQALLLGVDKFTEALKNAGIISEETYATVGGLRDKFNEGVTSLVFDPKKVKEEGDEAVKKAEKTAIELQNTLDGYENKKAANAKARADKGAADAKALRDKEAAEQAKADAERIASEQRTQKAIAEANNQRLADAEALSEEIYQAGLTAQQRELLAVQDTYFEKIELAKQYGLDYQALLDEQAASEAEIKKKYADETIASEKALADQVKADKEKEEQFALEVENAKYQAASSTLGALGDLATTFAGKNEAAAKKAFQVNKAASLAQAAIDTYGAANAIFKTASANPITTAFPAYPFIQAGVVVAAGLANIAKISKTQFNGGGASGGGSASGGGASTPASSFGSAAPAPLTPSFSLFGQGNQLNNVGGTQTTNGSQSQQLAVNVSISETEITKKQNFATKVQESATL